MTRRRRHASRCHSRFSLPRADRLTIANQDARPGFSRRWRQCSQRHSYVEGARFEPSQARKDWAAKLRADADAGKIRRNVHVVREPLSRFLTFQFEWGYAYNAEAGQDIRVLSVDAGVAAAHLMHVGDFTVVEHKDVVCNRYDDDGRFLGAVQASSDAAQVHAALAEVVWESAVPFTEWWAQHPQYHRAMQAA